MTEVVYAPLRKATLGRSLFLAGSIEMGTAEKWQDKIIDAKLWDFNIIYNPRRLDWNSAMSQDIDDVQFNNQVNWELDMIEKSTHVVFYFDPATKSPITLMELGYVAGIKKPNQVYVCCPQGFWRKGNVDIICDRKGFQQYSDINKLIKSLEYARLNR